MTRLAFSYNTPFPGWLETVGPHSQGFALGWANSGLSGRTGDR